MFEVESAQVLRPKANIEEIVTYRRSGKFLAILINPFNGPHAQTLILVTLILVKLTGFVAIAAQRVGVTSWKFVRCSVLYPLPSYTYWDPFYNR